MIQIFTGPSARYWVYQAANSAADTVMMYKPAQKPNRVTAVFENTEFSFDVAHEATLAQLVEQLSMLAEVHGGLPLSVDVRVPVDRRH
jgi:hypothetical protein